MVLLICLQNIINEVLVSLYCYIADIWLVLSTYIFRPKNRERIEDFLYVVTVLCSLPCTYKKPHDLQNLWYQHNFYMICISWSALDKLPYYFKTKGLLYKYMNLVSEHRSLQIQAWYLTDYIRQEVGMASLHVNAMHLQLVIKLSNSYNFNNYNTSNCICYSVRHSSVVNCCITEMQKWKWTRRWTSGIYETKLITHKQQ